MTFIYEFNSYALEIYWMCENELPTSRLSKVIVFQTYIQTDRQRDALEIIYHSTSRVVNSNNAHSFFVLRCAITAVQTNMFWPLGVDGRRAKVR